jgi:hypothetical protein
MIMRQFGVATLALGMTLAMVSGSLAQVGRDSPQGVGTGMDNSTGGSMGQKGMKGSGGTMQNGRGQNGNMQNRNMPENGSSGMNNK